MTDLLHEIVLKISPLSHTQQQQILSVEFLDAKVLSNTLYSMNGLSSHSPAVRLLLTHIMIPLVQTFRGSLSDTNMSNALLGMKRMSTDHGEVRRLLSEMCLKASAGRELVEHRQCRRAVEAAAHFGREHDCVVQIDKILAFSLPRV